MAEADLELEAASGGHVQALRPGTHQNVAYTDTAGTIGTALERGIVEIVCTSAAYVKVGANPTATTSDMYVPANMVKCHRVNEGDKVSALQVSDGGTLHVTQMN